MNAYIVFYNATKIYGVFSNEKIAKLSVEILKKEGRTRAFYEVHPVWKR